MLKIAIVLKGKQRKRKMIMNPFIFDKILQKMGHTVEIPIKSRARGHNNIMALSKCVQ